MCRGKNERKFFVQRISSTNRHDVSKNIGRRYITIDNETRVVYR